MSFYTSSIEWIMTEAIDKIMAKKSPTYGISGFDESLDILLAHIRDVVNTYTEDIAVTHKHLNALNCKIEKEMSERRPAEINDVLKRRFPKRECNGDKTVGKIL